MKSSSGQHYIGLDHVRALAAFMVFSWHFIHVDRVHKIPFGYLPDFFPMSLFNEGHTGVALFMTLSGYLFAKLLDGKEINYIHFLYNRALRLLPLLFFVLSLRGLLMARNGRDMTPYVKDIVAGIVLPTLPNGGWSITTEFHFYLLLPLLLVFSRKSRGHLFLVVLSAIAIRTALYLWMGQIQTLAYWTFVGRVDQFVLGMLGFYYCDYISGR